ncbi:MAG TPA: ABC transporter ATP-binding protein [bacterium]|nr:ABC transporter ATP-binding protein [bacterium]
MTAVLDLRDLRVAYGRALALDGITLAIEEGEAVAVLGPNGAGKTTLLRAISRTTPATGSVRFLGNELLRLPPHLVARLGIAHCPERRRLFPELSVLKNLLLGAYGRRDHQVLEEDLERVFRLFPALRDRRPQIAATLSGGEQQMVALGRALMARPRLLMLDEPSIGLAPLIKAAIRESLHEICQGGITLLLVEQDAAFALSLANRAYVLESGQVRLSGPSEALRGDPRVREAYLGIA